jgi:mRNA interferase HigB
MHVVARKTLKRFVENLRGRKDQKAVKSALDAWFHEAQQAEWKSPADVRKAYASASIISSERVVFNIKGNDYRLVAAIQYRRQMIFIKWLGSHAEYDKIDVRTVQYGN